MNRLLFGMILLAVGCLAGSCTDDDEYTHIMIVSLLLEKQEQQKSNKAKVIQQEQNLVGLQ